MVVCWVGRGRELREGEESRGKELDKERDESGGERGMKERWKEEYSYVTSIQDLLLFVLVGCHLNMGCWSFWLVSFLHLCFATEHVLDTNMYGCSDVIIIKGGEVTASVWPGHPGHPYS